MTNLLIFLAFVALLSLSAGVLLRTLLHMYTTRGPTTRGGSYDASDERLF